jgi:phenylacetate-CoA ligase
LRFIKKYQVHQLTLDHFKVKLIANSGMPATVPQQIAMDLRMLVGANTRIDVERVDEIPPAPSGKFRWVMSDISDVAEHALAEARNSDKKSA